MNGRPWPSFAQTNDVLSVTVPFGGARFDHCRQVGIYDREFSETVFRGEFTIPQRVLAQLAERRKAWPIAFFENVEAEFTQPVSSSLLFR